MSCGTETTYLQKTHRQPAANEDKQNREKLFLNHFFKFLWNGKNL